MEPNDELVVLYLYDADPDVVVELLGISTAELIETFPEKVEMYLERETTIYD